MLETMARYTEPKQQGKPEDNLKGQKPTKDARENSVAFSVFCSPQPGHCEFEERCKCSKQNQPAVVRMEGVQKIHRTPFILEK